MTCLMGFGFSQITWGQCVLSSWHSDPKISIERKTKHDFFPPKLAVPQNWIWKLIFPLKSPEFRLNLEQFKTFLLSIWRRIGYFCFIPNNQIPLAGFSDTKIGISKGVGPQKAALLNKRSWPFYVRWILAAIIISYEDRTKIFQNKRTFPAELENVQIIAKIRNVWAGSMGNKNDCSSCCRWTGEIELLGFISYSVFQKKFGHREFFYFSGETCSFGAEMEYRHTRNGACNRCKWATKIIFKPVYSTTEKPPKSIFGFLVVFQDQWKGCVQGSPAHIKSDPDASETNIKLNDSSRKRIKQIHFPSEPNLLQRSKAIKIWRVFSTYSFRLAQMKVTRLKVKGQVLGNITNLRSLSSITIIFHSNLREHKSGNRRIFSEFEVWNSKLNRLDSRWCGKCKYDGALSVLWLRSAQVPQTCLNLAPTEIWLTAFNEGSKEFAEYDGIKIAFA